MISKQKINKQKLRIFLEEMASSVDRIDDNLSHFGTEISSLDQDVADHRKYIENSAHDQESLGKNFGNFASWTENNFHLLNQRVSSVAHGVGLLESKVQSLEDKIGKLAESIGNDD